MVFFFAQVVQLQPSYEVYVSSLVLRTIRRDAKSATNAARHLVTEVFSEKACKECTVTGRPAPSKDGKPSIIRPPLDDMGFNAIFGNIFIFFHM